MRQSKFAAYIKIPETLLQIGVREIAYFIH